jgi:hypothetical protein
MVLKGFRCKERGFQTEKGNIRSITNTEMRDTPDNIVFGTFFVEIRYTSERFRIPSNLYGR